MTEPGRLFSKAHLSEVLQLQEAKAIEALESFDANRLLNTSVDDLVGYFIAEFKVEPLTIIAERISVGQAETKVGISQDELQMLDNGMRPVYVSGTRITYFIPFEGDQNLFHCCPSTQDYGPPRGIVFPNEVQFVFDQLDHDANNVKSAFEQSIADLRNYIQWVNRDVTQFNNRLKDIIHRRVGSRREKLLADRGLVASLGYPLRKRDNAPITYSVPIARKMIPSLPSATVAPFTPEPALDIAQYDDILSIISNMALVMERSPSAFGHMKEQDLRQHFLVQLNGQFEGQATGETFNFYGKTDILIRQNGKNIFIAECKFWRGPKVLIETIDQLLGYASWRDTKIAILVFYRGKSFGEVGKQIPDIVQQHPNFKRRLSCNGETNSRYTLHHNDDANRELVLTIMAFSVPEAVV